MPRCGVLVVFDMTLSGNEQGALFVLREENGAKIFGTGSVFLRRRVRALRWCGAVLAGIGLFVAQFAWWALLLVPLGALLVLFAPRLVRPADLLAVDATQNRLTILQPGAMARTQVMINGIVALEGVYEVHGWEPRSVLYAALSDGQRLPLLVFPGTDEALAQDVCGLVGAWIVRPASYTGADGVVKSCCP